MLIWIIQISLLSILIIFLVHNLFIFLKNTLTVPRTKDLVNAPMQKYNEIYRILKESEQIPQQQLPHSDQQYQDTMKNELKQFTHDLFVAPKQQQY